MNFESFPSIAAIKSKFDELDICLISSHPILPAAPITVIFSLLLIRLL